MGPIVANYIHSWLWVGLDWIFPPHCASCDKHGTRLCESCLSKISKVSPPVCDICGKPIKSKQYCSRCESSPPNITAIRSWVFYGEVVRKAIHQLKYRRNVALGDTFSNFLCDLLSDTGWEVDLITPVPLGKIRQKERGYNQAALIARPVALKSKINFQTRVIIRNRETLSQVNLSLEDRISNVDGAFSAVGDLVLGKNILVIDDITTSGSTLIACADALFLAGAKKVYGMTVARAR